VAVEDYAEPILQGESASVYERVLGGLVKQRFFPVLWDAQNRLTQLASEPSS
jgi:hypothetical protein